MADLGDVAEAGLGTYAYTKQQELVASNPGYRSYVERQQKIGLYVLGGIAVVATGIFLLGSKKEPPTTSRIAGENDNYELVFKKGMKSTNKDGVLKLSVLFENKGCAFYSKMLRNHANSLSA